MHELVGHPATWIIAAVAIAGAVFAAGKWYGAVNNDRDSFKEFMTEVRDDIKEILSRLSPPPVAGQSPVQLTDFGKEISEAVSAAEWARNEAAKLVDSAKGKEEFEIFEACMDHVSEAFAEDSEFEKSVKSGAYEIGTDSDSVLKVYQVELRDQILKLI